MSSRDSCEIIVILLRLPAMEFTSSILHVLRWLDLLYLALSQHTLIFIPRHRSLASIDFLHHDAFFNRTDETAQVAADADVLLDRVDVDRITACSWQDFHSSRAHDLRVMAVGPNVLI